MRTNVSIRCVMSHNGKIVLCRHNPTRGFYFCPGGGLEDGESIDDCVLRELSEEMGLGRGQIQIDSENHAIENIMTVDADAMSDADKKEYHVFGGKIYGIEIFKRVSVVVDSIKSKESHIAFEEFDAADLPSLDIRPAAAKDYIIKLCASADTV